MKLYISILIVSLIPGFILELIVYFDRLLCILGLHTPDNVDVGSEAFCIHCHKKLSDSVIWPRE